MAHRSERTITRMMARGQLPATHSADQPNKPLAIRRVDLAKLR